MEVIQSIWENQSLPEFPMLEGDRKTDVLIIGGGIAGLLCAWRLKQAGVDYLLVEAERICGGVTKNTTAKLTTQHGLIYHTLLERSRETAQAYLRASESALSEYRRLCRDIPCRYEQLPNYIYTTGHPERIEAELMALQELGRPGEYEYRLPLPFSTKGAVKVEGQAQFHPLAFLARLAPGLHILEQSQVLELTGNTALFRHGTVRFEKAIVTTHFPFWNRHGLYFMKLYQNRSYMISLQNAPDLQGMYLGDSEGSMSFRNFGGELIIGCGDHRTGNPSPGWKPAMELARKRYPQATLTHRWASQDCMSLDSLPYIGPYGKTTPNIYVATGFNKWGMTWAMAASKILTDLITNRPNDLAPFFSPSRNMLTPQLGSNLLASARGLLSLSEKRCPHLGCALKWNPQEHSWDCPCHGSRFSKSGELLADPAQKDLKQNF